MHRKVLIMPTIEIISVNANRKILRQEDYDIALIEEDKLVSHRSIFYEYLKTLNGIMVHIGNLDMKYDKEYGFFAGKIINWDFSTNKEIVIPNIDDEKNGADQDEYFQFLDVFKNEIEQIIFKYIELSPNSTALFLTDYQFGSSKPMRKYINLSNFWKEYNEYGLRWNTLYRINK